MTTTKVISLCEYKKQKEKEKRKVIISRIIKRAEKLDWGNDNDHIEK